MKSKHKKKNFILSIGCVIVTTLVCLIFVMYFLYCKIQDQTESSENFDKLVLDKVSKTANSYNIELESKTNIVWPKVQGYDKSKYPIYQPLLSIIKNWNPDNPDPPKYFNETLQHFNYEDLSERKLAEEYRNEEVPFKLYNVPDIKKANELWTDDYLITQMKSKQAHVEKSKSNHFMFWNIRGRSIRNYIPPTELVKLTFSEWLMRAYAADTNKIDNSSVHYYFMVGSTDRDRYFNKNHFIVRDLPIFSTTMNNYFITNVDANKGIQCRFSMRGIIAETHFDSGKNMVAMIKGSKRYILTPPYTCPKLGIIADKSHPSYRHSLIDWSDVDQAIKNDFQNVDAIDTIVKEGEVLYIPSYWFHYIISLRYSIQCNSRSGSPLNGQGLTDINQCMGETLFGNRTKNKRGKLKRSRSGKIK